MQQTTSPRTRARNQLIFALCLLGIAIAGYLLTRSFSPVQAPQEQAATSTPATTTSSTGATVPGVQSGAVAQRPASSDGQVLEGEYVCLPHRDTSGPQTTECALGLKADDGRYYAISASGATAESASATTPTGARVRLIGMVVPAEALSSDQWQRYAITGVMSVETFTRL